MQVPSHFVCRVPSCQHRCAVRNDTGGNVGPLSNLHNNNTSRGCYIIVSCPKCHTYLFHCSQCSYNTPRKNHINRHVVSHLGSATTNSDNDDTLDSGSFGHANNDAMDINYNNDDADDDNDTDDDDDNEDNDELLDELSTHEIVIVPPVDQVDVDQDEFLRNLVAAGYDDELLFDYDQLNPHGLLSIESFGLFGDNRKSKLYYWQNDVHRKLTNNENLLGGIMGITWRAIHQVCSCGTDDIANLQDTMLMFNMLQHALATKGEQQRNFFRIMSDAYYRMPINLSAFITSLGQDAKDQFDAFSESLNSEQLQTFNNLCRISGKSRLQLRLSSMKDDGAANAMLLQGRYSIMSGLPTPTVHIEESSGHAYVNISDVIDHAVADGLRILQLQDQHGKRNLHTINGSRAAAELLQHLRSRVSNPDNTAFGALLLWSDGFCRTYVKQKDNSVWILTLTFLNTDKKTKSPMHTYCIAIGKSSEDHTPVLEIIMRQLDDLEQARTRYCGITGTFIDTSFGIIAYSTDRIERCSVMNTMQLGIFGQRSHWACAIDPTRLPMCVQCFQRLISTLQTSPFPQLEVLDESGNICQECCQWDFEMAIGPLPANYPTMSSDGINTPTPPENRSADELQHMPMNQSFGWLRKGLLYAFHNSTVGDRRARWNKTNIETYLKSMAIKQKAIETLWRSVIHQRSNPNSDTLQFVPYLWNIEHVLPMERFINSPMHLLFHGIVDDVMKLVHRFMSKYKKLETFERFVNVHLLKIETFRLGWCKLRKLPKAFWLAEDILGFCRIMPCIYGLFFTNNFKFTRLSRRFVESSTSVKKLLNSLHVMISALMNPRTSTDVNKIDAYIKVYLSCGHEASKWINGKGEAFWMDKGNHLSLLNLPDQIAHFGPVRWYWEGVSEAFIHEVKPELVENMRKSETYFRDKLGLLYKKRSMEFINNLMRETAEEEEDDDDEGERSGKPNHSKGFYRYASLEDVQKSFETGLPISAFIFSPELVSQEKCLIWIAFGRGANTQLVPVQYYVAFDSVELCGLTYADCRLFPNNLYPQPFRLVEGQISSNCVLLPLIENHVNEEKPPFGGRYAVIYDDWDVLCRSGIKDEVLLSHKLFL